MEYWLRQLTGSCMRVGVKMHEREEEGDESKEEVE